MALAEHFVLNLAVVEVKYLKGMVYLDRCGSLMERLSDTLGPAFETNVPQMAYGELLNGIERLTVRYGPKEFTAMQRWVRSPVRVEMVGPDAWGVVAEMLGVQRQVSRVGVRFGFLWKVDDAAEAERRIQGARLFSELDGWEAEFGAPRSRSWTVTSESRAGTLRATVQATATEVKGGPLPADLDGVIPPHAIVLDLDYQPPGEAPFSMGGAQLKEFMRTSWERAKKSAGFVHQRLSEAGE